MRALLGLLLVLAARPVYADSAGELAEVRKIIEVQLRYKEGVDRLEKIILERRLDDAEKIEAHRLLAIASIARGEVARAESSFRTVLSIDPLFELDPGISPKISSVLDRVKKEIARAPKILDLEATPASEHVLFAARVQDPDARLVSIELYTRTAGDRFDQIRMERFGDQLSARVSAPDSTERVEYFLVGRDIEGEAIARVGDASQPSSLIVKRTIERTPSPLVPLSAPDMIEQPPEWYEHWWVWAIAVGVVGASVTTAVVLGRNGAEPPGGTLDPIQVP